MQQVYVFSGLGVDERVFTKINFGICLVTHIKWIEPPKNCSIEQYAQLLCKQITTPNPILLGLSFGGMLAIEVSKIIAAKKVIIISSIKTKYELPFWIRICGFLKLYHLSYFLPTKFLLNPNILVYKAFGIKTTEEKKLLQQIMADINPAFMRWALQIIPNWQNTFVPKNLVHIHGNNDGIFPIHKLNNAISISQAGHFMIRNKHKELNQILPALLNS